MKRKVSVLISFFAAAVMLISQSITITAAEPNVEKTLLNPYETVQTAIMENGGGFYEGDIQYSPIAGSKILKAENVDFSKGLTGIEVSAVNVTNLSDKPREINIITYTDNDFDGDYRYQAYNTAAAYPDDKINGVHFKD